MNLGFAHGVALLNASPNVIRFTPSLIIPEKDIMLGMNRFKTVLHKFSTEQIS
jgi:acetylornithine/succinyldiaminopimelate/putrescine aminotransferase